MAGIEHKNVSQPDEEGRTRRSATESRERRRK
jgi:hypothetical protein